MALAEETEMSPAEVDAFLGHRETGVISFAREGEPYAIPVSYGYDDSDRQFYLRLVSTPESTKRAFLDSSPRARFVVYDEVDGGSAYLSVVANGVLEAVDPDGLSVEQVAQYGDARRPLFEIWGVETADLDIELYEFDPEELSGRRTDVER